MSEFHDKMETDQWRFEQSHWIELLIVLDEILDVLNDILAKIPSPKVKPPKVK